RTRRAALSVVAFTSAPSEKTSSSPTLTLATTSASGFRKPRFGRRRCIGVWPPWKCFLLMLPLERAFWPFWPRPAVLPRPEPTPRPTRVRAWVAPSGAWSLERMSMLLPALGLDLLDLEEVDDLLDHAAEGRRVRHHDLGARAAQAETLDHLAV